MTRLTARLADLTNSTAPGAVLVIDAPPVKDIFGATIYTGGRTVPFKDGELEVDLLANDTPGTDPLAWSYRFTVMWSGGSLPPFSTDGVTGLTVDLTELQPMDPTNPVYVPREITQADVVGLEESLGDLTDKVTDLTEQVRSPGVWTPSENGLVSAIAPPRAIIASHAPPIAVQYVTRMWVPAGAPITSTCVYVGTAGVAVAGAVATVYEADGSRSGRTSTITSDWQSAGAKTNMLITPVPAQPAGRWVWVSFYVASATTSPAFGFTSNLPLISNLNQEPKSSGYLIGPPAASVNLASITNYVEFWAGLS